MDNFTSWLEGKQAAQDALAAHDEPAFTSTEVTVRLLQIQKVRWALGEVQGARAAWQGGSVRRRAREGACCCSARSVPSPVPPALSLQTFTQLNNKRKPRPPPPPPEEKSDKGGGKEKEKEKEGEEKEQAGGKEKEQASKEGGKEEQQQETSIEEEDEVDHSEL